MKKQLVVILLFLACISFAATKVTIDEDGMLKIDGQRKFIIGSYHLPKGDDPYNELAEAGFNLLRVGNSIEEFDKAQQAGLKVWHTVGTLDLDDSEESTKLLTAQINQFKDHPALAIWESVDEPAWTWMKAEARIQPEPFAKAYKLIKSIDPNHVMYMNHAPVNLVSTMQKYNTGTDIVACDIYPVIPHGIKQMFALFPDGLQGDLSNTTISQVGEYADKMRRVAGPDKPQFMVLQGFSWEMLRKEDRDSTKILFPTLHQTRFMAYNAIIHQSNGLVYWGMSYTPQPSEFWTNLKTVTKEIGALQDVLAAKTIPLKINKTYYEMGHSIDAGVEILAKKMADKLYLITANADKNPVKVTLADFGEFERGIEFHERRKIDCKRLIEIYEPYQVRVFEFSDEK